MAVHFVFTETINRTVVVNMEVNDEFKEEYEEPSSLEYKTFVKNFTVQVRCVDLL